MLQPGIVQHEALDDVLAQSLGGPTPEVHAHMTVHTVAYRDDHVEVVVFHQPFHVTPAFPRNCKEILYSWIGLQFAIGQNVLDVLTDVLFRGLEKLRELVLVEPYRLFLHPNAHLREAVLALIDQ